MTQLIQPTDSLAQLATRIPAASRVFDRHDLDFCCGGNRSLASACTEAGLDAAAVIAEIEDARPADADAVRWDERPLPELVTHILDRYHEPLYPELDRLEEMAQKVLAAHGERHPDRIPRLATAIGQLAGELRVHMMKEERVLFPWIMSGNGRAAGAPISVMQHEHDAAADMLRAMRALTDDYTPPEDACATWTALYVRLKELDRELREHIHLENNVLFPRALAE